MCPKGNFALYANTVPTPEVQAVILTNVFNPVTDLEGGVYNYKSSSENSADTNGQFALTFRSTLNEEFTTNVMNVYSLTEEIVEQELNQLPNKVIEEAEVVLYRNLSKYNYTTYGLGRQRKKQWDKYPFTDANNWNYTWYDTDLVLLITYAGAMTSGNQYALECKTAYCDDGCQPKMATPIDFKMSSECVVVNDYQMAWALNVECSGRGTCDYTSGICECYEGYTDEFCSTQTALI